MLVLINFQHSRQIISNFTFTCFVCVHAHTNTHMHICHGVHVYHRRLFVRVGCPLLPRGYWELNSVCQTWQQVLLFAKPSKQLSIILLR